MQRNLHTHMRHPTCFHSVWQGEDTDRKEASAHLHPQNLRSQSLHSWCSVVVHPAAPMVWAALGSPSFPTQSSMTHKNNANPQRAQGQPKLDFGCQWLPSSLLSRCSACALKRVRSAGTGMSTQVCGCVSPRISLSSADTPLFVVRNSTLDPDV